MVTPDSLRMPADSLAGRLETLLEAPAELLLPERLLLYALVRALAPARCLEIGTHFGGSTRITCAALDDVGTGVIVCVDPAPCVAADVWAAVQHRAVLVRAGSPAALHDARAQAGGPFDFVFVDGDHTTAGVVADLEGALDVAAPGAVVVCHDAHHPDVRDGIDHFVAAAGAAVVDGGLVSVAATDWSVDAHGRRVQWAGLRMLRLPGVGGLRHPA